MRLFTSLPFGVLLIQEGKRGAAILVFSHCAS